MIGCGACGAANPPDFRFCGTCGSSLATRACPSCGFDSPVAYRYCGRCGTDLDAGVPTGATGPAGAFPLGEAPGVAGERKLATVLFADVVGFTSLADRLDHETLARRVDDALQRLGEVVVAHGGTVDKYMGDSLMAVFGVPQAHDDDAERAVAAGLAMRGVVTDLGFSIGINTGEVTVTPAGPSGVTVIGDAVNVAARLEKAATRDQVLVGALTYELTRSRIAYRAQPAMVLKGKREPVEVWEAVRLRSGLAGTGDEPALVGRDDDLAYLRGVWRRVVSERRFSAVLVIGEAGVGKTRLLRELGRSITTEGPPGRVVQIHYPAYASRRRALTDLVEQMGYTGEEAVDERIRSLVAEPSPELRAMDPAALREEQVWAFRRLIERAASEQPLLLSFDGLERATTTQLVRFLSSVSLRLSGHPVMVVLAGRPEPSLWLNGFPTATRMRLQPLGPSDSLTLAETLAPDVDWCSAEGAAVLERAAGNALYIRELAAVVQAGGLEAGRTLPPTLRSVLSARLDALGPTEKAVLQHLALLGDTFGEHDLALLDPSAPAALPGLVTQGLLRPRTTHGFEFVDPLLRDVAYESLPHAVRSERHLAAARAVADLVEKARHLELAAGYLEDDKARADVASSMASIGVDLLDQSRTVDGIRVLEEARRLGCTDAVPTLRLARELSDTRPEDAIAILSTLPHRLPDAALDAERVHIAAGAESLLRPEKSLGLYDEAARRWAAIGRRDKEGWAYSNKAVTLFSLGRMMQTDEYLVRAIELFRMTGEKAGERAASTFRANVRPEHPEVATWLADGLSWAEAVGDKTQQLNAVRSLGWHHVLRGRLGGRKDMVEAEHWLDRAVALASDLGDEVSLLTSFVLRAHLARMRGEIDEAVTFAKRARRAVEDQPLRPANRLLLEAVEYSVALADGAAPPPLAFPPGVRDPIASVANVFAAEAELLAGRAHAALDRLHSGRVDWHERNDLGLQVGGMGDALAHLLLGELDEAASTAERTARTSARTGAHAGAVAAIAIQAEACARSGDREHAAELLDGLDAADETGGLAGVLVLRARVALGEAGALDALRAGAAELRAPGLLDGVAAAV